MAQYMHDRGTDRLLRDVANAKPVHRYTPTPGPLFAHPDENGIAWHVSNRADDDDAHPDYKRTARTTDSENAEADARLYALAPELRAFVEMVGSGCTEQSRLESDAHKLLMKLANGGAA